MASCLNCEKELNQGRNCTGKYCNNQCQQTHQKRIRYQQIELGLALTSESVKRYLIDKHTNRCLDSNCCWDFTKRPINVELEHIDGNSENNTLENCTLLCPNCHSQTSTYKAKNKGNGRHARRVRYAEGKNY